MLEARWPRFKSKYSSPASTRQSLDRQNGDTSMLPVVRNRVQRMQLLFLCYAPASYTRVLQLDVRYTFANLHYAVIDADLANHSSGTYTEVH